MKNKVFNALIIEEKDDGTFSQNIKEKRINELPEGDQLIREKYSS